MPEECSDDEDNRAEECDDEEEDGEEADDEDESDDASEGDTWCLRSVMRCACDLQCPVRDDESVS